MDRFGLKKTAVAYMGLGVHLGSVVSQNGLGHVLTNEKNFSDDPSDSDRGPDIEGVRAYPSNARHSFHTDGCDIVGHLCVASVPEGDGSHIVSAHDVYNALEREQPDVFRTLMQQIWYFDRNCQTTPDNQDDWIKGCALYLERMTLSNLEGTLVRAPRVYLKFDPAHVLRGNSDAEIPSPSPEQETAIKVLEATCARLATYVPLDLGDLQFLANSHVLHARGAPGYGTMRLWLATPESRGGWRLPFADSDEKRRGGVQVGEQEPCVPIADGDN